MKRKKLLVSIVSTWHCNVVGHRLQLTYNKMLNYRRYTALQGTLVLAKSGRPQLGDIFYGHYRSIGEKTQNKGYHGIQGTGVNRKQMDASIAREIIQKREALCVSLKSLLYKLLLLRQVKRCIKNSLENRPSRCILTMKTAFSVTSANIPYYNCLRFIFAVVW